MKRLKNVYAKFIQITTDISSCGRLCCTDGIFLYAVFYSDYLASADAGTLYTGDEGGCDDCCNPCVSHICGLYDYLYR